MTRPFLDNQSARRLFLDRHLLLRPGAGPGRGEAKAFENAIKVAAPAGPRPRAQQEVPV